MTRLANGLTALMALLALPIGAAEAQSRIKQMPGYDNWAAVAPLIPTSVKSGAIAPVWAADSRSFEYVHDGKRWRYALGARKAKAVGDATLPEAAALPSTGAPAETLVLARGRGADAVVFSPDGKLRAFSRDLNVWMAPTTSKYPETQLSLDGDATARIRNGTGSYVYLEEFGVKSPVWWSPDSSKIAWMRYDESMVEDYYLQLDQTRTQSTMLTQAYPHAGAANPVADLMVHDVKTGQTRRMDVRDGLPFSDAVVGHYVWNAQWTKDGAEILVRRADRRQKINDLAACSPVTGACRSVAREERPATWASAAPPIFLSDGQRFIWTTEASGFRNFQLRHLDGRVITNLTSHGYDVVDVLKVDERENVIWYTARSGDNYMKVQLHRVKLDGSGDVRLTDPAFNHKVSIAPDGRHVVDVAQTHDIAPVARLLDRDGRILADVVGSDLAAFREAGFSPQELFTFTSADGATELHGLIQYPARFDPARKYPVLLSVYGGPASNGAAETFNLPSPLAEFGFVIVKMDARTAAGKGRQGLDAMYQQLTVAEVDDFAAGLQSLRSRPWFDAARVGVFGTSYGGTVSASLLMRHPEVIKAAVSNSPVTDYRLYDTAYSERYLGLPDTDAAAYDRAALLTYADQLRGDLMIYYGTSDDNVHPKNALHLIRALQAAGKSFDVQVGPDRGHTSMDQLRMMEFFIDKLSPAAGR
jgi:dipeptidyl-peptidase-4